jgi:hypothetical protein
MFVEVSRGSSPLTVHPIPAAPAPPPTRFVRLDQARSRFGDQVDRLGAFFWVGDPLADQAAAALAPLPRATREALLASALGKDAGASKDSPEPIRALFASLDHVPYWLEAPRAARGGRAFLGTGLVGGFVLAFASLVLGYCSPAGNKPLALSGRLRENAPRRLAETSRFVQAVSLPGGMDRFGDGFAIAARVRLMHAQVRRMCETSPQWDRAAWGTPINQVDMAGTVLLFSLIVIDGLAKLGFPLRPGEAEDLLHLWRRVGSVLGVEDELLPTSERDARRLWELIASTQEGPDADARSLAAALIEGGVLRAKSAEERREAARRAAIGYGLSRYLVGRDVADALGYPPSTWGIALPMLSATLRTTLGAARRVPPVEAWLASVGERRWNEVVAAGLGATPATFPIPEELGAPR